MNPDIGRIELHNLSFIKNCLQRYLAKYFFIREPLKIKYKYKLDTEFFFKYYLVLKYIFRGIKMKQRGFFDEVDRLQELTKMGDPLILLEKKINWESFRRELEKIRPPVNPENEKNAGRKPFDVVMMFKVMILQRYYTISDDQMEFQLKDRRSFERFVSGGDTLYHMPDAKTIWVYRERSEEIEEKLLELGYKSRIHERGYRNRPLSEKQIAANKEKSKVRVRVEHIFGILYWMGADYLYYIGKNRIDEAIGMINLTYNMRRYCFLSK